MPLSIFSFFFFSADRVPIILVSWQVSFLHAKYCHPWQPRQQWRREEKKENEGKMLLACWILGPAHKLHKVGGQLWHSRLIRTSEAQWSWCWKGDSAKILCGCACADSLMSAYDSSSSPGSVSVMGLCIVKAVNAHLRSKRNLLNLTSVLLAEPFCECKHWWVHIELMLAQFSLYDIFSGWQVSYIFLNQHLSYKTDWRGCSWRVMTQTNVALVDSFQRCQAFLFLRGVQ